MNSLSLSLVLLSTCLLSSCFTSNSPKEFTPSYLKKDSNLDKPGTASARAAERNKRKKDGAFALDANYALHGGKVFLFKMNPEYADSASGKTYKAKTAKVIFCEGTYYFVELDTKERGYIQETSMVPIRSLMGDMSLTMDGFGWVDALPASANESIDTNFAPLFPSDRDNGLSPTTKTPAPAVAPASQDIPDLPDSTID